MGQVRMMCAGWLKAVDEMTWWRASANNGWFGGRAHSRGRLKEDGSDDDQLELIGSTCALESTFGGLELRSQGKRL